MRKNWKKAAVLITVLSMLLTGYTVVNASSIGSVLSGIVARVIIAFENIGGTLTHASEAEMADIAARTKTTINGMVSKTQEEIQSELEAYKDSQLEKKNQEVEALVNSAEASIKQKKAEKLDEYKQKIDEKIDKEYDKLMKDLTEGL